MPRSRRAFAAGDRPASSYCPPPQRQRRERRVPHDFLRVPRQRREAVGDVWTRALFARVARRGVLFNQRCDSTLLSAPRVVGPGPSRPAACRRLRSRLTVRCVEVVAQAPPAIVPRNRTALARSTERTASTLPPWARARKASSSACMKSTRLPTGAGLSSRRDISPSMVRRESRRYLAASSFVKICCDVNMRGFSHPREGRKDAEE